MARSALLSLLLLVLVTGRTLAQPGGEMIDGIIAVVGTEPVLYSELAGRLESGAATAGPEVCAGLEDLLFERALLDQARLDSVVVDEAQVQSELDRRIRYFEAQIGGREALEEFYGKTVAEIKDDFHDQVADQLLVQTMQRQVAGDVRLTPREVERFFKEIPEDSLPFINAEVEYEMVLRIPEPSEEEDRRTRQRLEGFRESVLSGDKDFCTLAILYSQDPGSASDCGELGMVPTGVMVPEFDAVALSLKDGEVSQVFRTEFGYHFMQMVERRGEQFNARHILLQPQVTSQDLERERRLLDSLATLVRDGRVGMSELAAEYSDDEASKSNNGLVVDPVSNSQRWPMNELDRETALVIDALSPGEVAQPQLVVLPDGKKAYRIIRLRSRSEPHVADLERDYRVILQAAEASRRADEVDGWVREKVGTTYVRIDPRFASCSFRNAWTGDAGQ